MPRHLTPSERLSVVQEVDALATTAKRQARLRELGVSWGSYRGWRKRAAAEGLDGLYDGLMGRPRGNDRIVDLETRVTRLEQLIISRED